VKNLKPSGDECKKHIVLGVTGSIAAYKALELARIFKKDGYEVWIVMTESAKKFVAPLSFQTLTGNPVFCDLFFEQDVASSKPENINRTKQIKQTSPIHIDLARDALIIVVAPATANIIAKAAAGIADDLLSTVLLSASSPVVFVPAMNFRMWESAITQRNVKYLKSTGVKFIEPETGYLACEEVGKGRFPPIDTIFKQIKAILYKDEKLKGKNVVITAGRTEEPIDPIRVLTNRSSGRMGVELAKAAKDAGAKVKLIAGNLAVAVPSEIDCTSVRTTRQMEDAVNSELSGADILIMTAAVCDYRPLKSSSNKEKKSNFTLQLIRTSDILKGVARKKHKAYVVGFSLDTKDNIAEARRKMREKKLDLIVANPITTLEGETTKPTIIFNKSKQVKVQKLPAQTKKAFAEKLIEIISKETSVNYETK
jgi:phosphopantothenoylcysteine decarboxylase/phosphopantothenate--cysteine ligase